MGLTYALVLAGSVCQAGLENSLITAAEVKGEMGKGGLTLIDVRPSLYFDDYHIPGSINMQPFVIKTRRFLKNKKIVLVDRAVSFCRPLEIRQQLLAKGFKQVLVLKGGLTAWNKDTVNSSLSTLQKHFLQGLLKCDWIKPSIIDLRKEDAFKKRNISGSVNLPYETRDKKQIARFLDEAAKTVDNRAGREPLHPIILVDSSGRTGAALVSAFKKNQRPFTYFLEGGTREWYLEADYQPSQESTRPGKAPLKGCPSCE